jgi:hypothetical protein
VVVRQHGVLVELELRGAWPTQLGEAHLVAKGGIKHVELGEQEMDVRNMRTAHNLPYRLPDVPDVEKFRIEPGITVDTARLHANVPQPDLLRFVRLEFLHRFRRLHIKRVGGRHLPVDPPKHLLVGQLEQSFQIWELQSVRFRGLHHLDTATHDKNS